MPNEELPGDLIDMKTAARLLHCRLASAYRFVFSGKLRGWKRVGRWFVSEADVRALFHPHKTSAEIRTEKEQAQAKDRAQRNAFTEAMLKDMGYRK